MAVAVAAALVNEVEINGKLRFPAGPNTVILDMGAQVMTVNHNNADAVSECQSLLQKGIFRKAHGLCETEERPSGPHISNFWVPNGTSTLLRKYLDEARVQDLRFGRRVLGIEQLGGHNTFLVTAGEGDVSDPHGKMQVSRQMQEEFNCIIATGTGHDIVNIHGISQVLPPELKNGLSSVQYS